MKNFKALITRELQNNQFSNEIETLPLSMLNPNHVLVKVDYSSLNYKDALSFQGHRGVTKIFPHIPGIDAVGEVINDPSGKFLPETKVLVTGFDMGMNSHGGFSELVSVPAEWLIQLNISQSLQYQMELGTAGLTAGMAIFQLLKNDLSKDKPILVSGATGGVALIALLILKKLGYKTIALTRKGNHPILTKIPVDDIWALDEFLKDSSRALYPTKISGAIDTVGGDILTKIIKSTDMAGSVSVCGMAYSTSLNLEVFPFILRGIKLLGINSADSSIAYKKQIWELLNNDWKIDLSEIVQEISLEEVPSHLNSMLEGTSVGRKIVKINP